MKLKFQMREMMALMNRMPQAETISKLRKSRIKREELERALEEGRWKVC